METSNRGQPNEGFVDDGAGSLEISKQPRPPTKMKPETTTKVSRSALKNVILIAIAFMVLFTSYQSMAALQSSINQVIRLRDYFLNDNVAQCLV